MIYRPISQLMVLQLEEIDTLLMQFVLSPFLTLTQLVWKNKMGQLDAYYVYVLLHNMNMALSSPKSTSSPTAESWRREEHIEILALLRLCSSLWAICGPCHVYSHSQPRPHAMPCIIPWLPVQQEVLWGSRTRYAEKKGSDSKVFIMWKSERPSHWRQ